MFFTLQQFEFKRTISEINISQQTINEYACFYSFLFRCHASDVTCIAKSYWMVFFHPKIFMHVARVWFLFPFFVFIYLISSTRTSE